MRFLAALLFCFSACLVLTSCDKDDDMAAIAPIDCEIINTFDTMQCISLATDDSVAYVNAFLGSWYLAAQQGSGFGGTNRDCLTYTEEESPYKFTFNSDNTWRVRQTGMLVNPDTTLGWTAVSGFGGWTINSNSSTYPMPRPSHDCSGNLVMDLRPLDGSLLVYAKTN